METENRYVYQHITHDGRIFYVGKGSGNRSHQRRCRNAGWHKVALDGYVVELLAKGLDDEGALFLEQEVIDLYKRRGIALTNQTRGGEGCPGFRHTEEHKQRMRGKPVAREWWGKTFKGRKHSPEARALMSEQRRGKDNGKWKGKKRSAESRAKMSAAAKGKPKPWRRVLTDEQVREIRSRIGYRNIEALAREFGVGATTIRRIRDA